MTYKVEFSAEFDNFGYPPKVGKIEIRIDSERGSMQSLVIVLDDEEIILMTVSGDQWGVWYSLMNATKDKDGKLSHYLQSTTIAQEDETRSFMDALIKSLTILKDRNEVMTEEATVSIINEEGLQNG